MAGRYASLMKTSPNSTSIAQPAPPAEEAKATAPTWPEPPAAEAYHETAGELVHKLGPQSEADPVALLIQTLVAFGNVIGRTAHFRVEGDVHYLNLFAVLVGETAKARKGTSWGRIRWVFDQIETEWAGTRIMSGLSSGEGLIWNVRDPIMAREKVKERGRVTAIQEYEADAGEADKRLLVLEPEYAVVLRQIERNGNTLSAVLRQGWETGNLRTLTKNSPVKATGAHLSMVGHVTAEELCRYLSSTEAASGFANRFLWLCVRRSKCLPDGGELQQLRPYVETLTKLVAFGRTVGEMHRDKKAKELWHQVYPELSEGKPGLAGALLARGEAQTMRLACLYALLDKRRQVEARHLKAALALWSYCERSVRFIFGESLGDEIADELLAILREKAEGLTRTDIRDTFSRHAGATRIDRALALLQRLGLVECRKENTTGGRPPERWLFKNGRAT
jgi:hypothetical protein